MTKRPPDEQEWLDWRAGGVGASDVADAATGRYGGATKVVAARLGITVDQIDPALADRGHRWEGPIADMVHVATGLWVVGEQTWLEHPDNRRRRATLDGFLARAPEVPIDDVVAVLEVKTRAPHSPWPWDYWTAQVQTQMDIAGLGRALLAIATVDTVLDPATLDLSEQLVDLKLRWVDADPLAQADLADLADRLLEQIDAGVIPEPTDAAALPWIEAANRIADPGAGADIDDLAELIARFDVLAEAAREATEERNAARARIVHRMGAATEATTSDGAWRVRLGSPVRRLTRSAEDEFIDLYCLHRPDCPPGCDRHRPDLLDARLNVELAEQEGYADEVDEAKHPTTERRLTVKRMTPEEES